MLYAIAAVIGVAAGAILTWLLLQRSRTEERSQASARARAEAEQAAAQVRAEAAVEQERLRGQAENLSQQLRTREAELEAAAAELQQLRAQRLADTEQIGGAEGEIKRLTALRELEAQTFKERLEELAQAEARLKEAFSALAADSLHRNNQSFLELAREQLGQMHEAAKGELEKRQQAVDTLVKPVREELAKLERLTAETEGQRKQDFGALMQQMGALQAAEKALHSKADDLTTALRGQPTKWGRWGELQLRRVVEIAGMLEYVDFIEQESQSSEQGRLRPDMIVRLPSQRSLAVDSKSPVELYVAAMELVDEAARRSKLEQYAKAVRGHLTELTKRAYWERLEGSPEFVVMFLPGESYFSAALEADPELIEFGAQQRVILATPTTLIALLRAVAYGWRQEQLADNARQISEAGRVLYKRLCTFTEHLLKAGRALGTATGAYNDAVGSLERSVLPQARRMQELGATDKDELPELPPIDAQPRQLSLPEQIVEDVAG